MALNRYVDEELGGDFPYKVHSVLEGLGDNRSAFSNVEGLREKVGDFFTEFNLYPESADTDEYALQVHFQTYLEDGEEYDLSTRLTAQDKLSSESSDQLKAVD